MAGEQTSSGAAARDAGGSGTGSTTSGGKEPLVTRVQRTLDRAADEHRANSQQSQEGSRGPRRARLRLTRVDPWSVMKTAFLLSIALGIVTFVAVAVVWGVLSAAGVWSSINQLVQNLLGGETAAGFDVQDYVGMSRILGITVLVAALDVILVTAIATLAAFLYNLAAALLGGIDVTLVEDH